jgi:hypothetical protein
MTRKQLTTAIISSLKAASSTSDESVSNLSSTASKKSNQAGNSFGEKDSAKRAKVD